MVSPLVAKLGSLSRLGSLLPLFVAPSPFTSGGIKLDTYFGNKGDSKGSKEHLFSHSW